VKNRRHISAHFGKAAWQRALILGGGLNVHVPLGVGAGLSGRSVSVMRTCVRPSEQVGQRNGVLHPFHLQ
jgi:hypothetical protein